MNTLGRSRGVYRRHKTRRRLLQCLLAAGVNAVSLPIQAQALRRGKQQYTEEWIANSIKIGLLQPLDGPLAPFAERALAAALDAISWVNLKGGIENAGNRPLHGIRIPVANTPTGAADAVQQARDADVSAIIGSSTTPLTYQVALAAADHQLPVLIDGAIGDQLTGENNLNAFRFGPSFSQHADRLAALIDELVMLEGGPPDVEPEETVTASVTASTGDPAAALAPPSSEEETAAPLFRIGILRGFGGFAAAVAEALEDRLDDELVTIDPVIDVMPNDSLDDSINALAEADPDWVVMLAFSELFENCLDALAAQSWQPKALISLLGPMLTDPGFRQRRTDQISNLIDIGVWPNANMPETALFLRRFNAAKVPVTMDTILAHESVFLLEDALEQVDSLDREALMSALRNSTYQSGILPYGITSFSDGQNEAAVSQVLQVQDGAIVSISEPAELRYVPEAQEQEASSDAQ